MSKIRTPKVQSKPVYVTAPDTLEFLALMCELKESDPKQYRNEMGMLRAFSLLKDPNFEMDARTRAKLRPVDFRRAREFMSRCAEAKRLADPSAGAPKAVAL